MSPRTTSTDPAQPSLFDTPPEPCARPLPPVPAGIRFEPLEASDETLDRLNDEQGRKGLYRYEPADKAI